MNKENAARDYIRQVKAIFPLYGRERKRFINDLKDLRKSFFCQHSFHSFRILSFL